MCDRYYLLTQGGVFPKMDCAGYLFEVTDVKVVDDLFLEETILWRPKQ